VLEWVCCHGLGCLGNGIVGGEPDATCPKVGGIVAAYEGWGLGNKFVQASGLAVEVIVEALKILQCLVDGRCEM